MLDDEQAGSLQNEVCIITHLFPAGPLRCVWYSHCIENTAFCMEGIIAKLKVNRAVASPRSPCPPSICLWHTTGGLVIVEIVSRLRHVWQRSLWRFSCTYDSKGDQSVEKATPTRIWSTGNGPKDIEVNTAIGVPCPGLSFGSSLI